RPANWGWTLRRRLGCCCTTWWTWPRTFACGACRGRSGSPWRWKCDARRTHSTRALPWRRSCWGEPEGETRLGSRSSSPARHETPIVALSPPRDDGKNRRRDPIDVCRSEERRVGEEGGWRVVA